MVCGAVVQPSLVIPPDSKRTSQTLDSEKKPGAFPPRVFHPVEPVPHDPVQGLAGRIGRLAFPVRSPISGIGERTGQVSVLVICGHARHVMSDMPPIWAMGKGILLASQQADQLNRIVAFGTDRVEGFHATTIDDIRFSLPGREIEVLFIDHERLAFTHMSLEYVHGNLRQINRYRSSLYGVFH